MTDHQTDLHMLRIAGSATLSAGAVHLFSLPGQNSRILACEAQVTSVRCRCREGRLDAEGTLRMTLYTAQSGQLCAQEATEPFSLAWNDPAISPASQAEVWAFAARPRLRREGEGRYRAECGIEAEVRLLCPETAQVLTDLSGIAAETETADCHWLAEWMQAEAEWTLQEDVLLPEGSPEAEEILTASAAFTPLEAATSAGSLHCRGEVRVSVLYRDGEDELHRAEFTLPLEEEARFAGEEGGSPRVLPGVCETAVKIYPDVDGAKRLLHLTLRVPVRIDEARMESARLLEDAFALEGELALTRESVRLPQAPFLRPENLPVEATAELEGEPPEAVLACLARAQLDSVSADASGTAAEATLFAQILCRDAEGTLRAVNLQCPLHWDLGDCPADTEPEFRACEITAHCEGGRWRLTGRVPAILRAFPEMRRTLVTEAAYTEAEAAPAWSLKLLLAGPEESLWSLARRGGVTRETLAACNPALRERAPKEGEAIVVMR